jgi:hypothetical protein
LTLQAQQLEPARVLGPVPHLGGNGGQLGHARFPPPSILLLPVLDVLLVANPFSGDLPGEESDVVRLV